MSFFGLLWGVSAALFAASRVVIRSARAIGQVPHAAALFAASRVVIRSARAIRKAVPAELFAASRLSLLIGWRSLSPYKWQKIRASTIFCHLYGLAELL